MQKKKKKKNYKKDYISNTYEFCNGDINKFILLLRKGVYPYEYMVIGNNLMKNQY